MIQHGPGDPTTRVNEAEAWRTARTPDGPGTIALRRGDDGITAEAFGPGGNWLLDRAGQLVGAEDDPAALLPLHDVVAVAAQRFPGLRLPRTNAVVHELVVAILGQRVTAIEAVGAWRGLCRAASEPAPGPGDLLLPPDPDVLAGQPYWWYHRFGVDRRRAETIKRVAARAARVEALASPSTTTTTTLAEAADQLRRHIGIGPWTIGKVLGVALGDPDAVCEGDFHLPNLVAWALAHEPRADDARMLELLEPYRGQRGRVIRLLEQSGVTAPKYGPRRPISPITHR